MNRCSNCKNCFCCVVYLDMLKTQKDDITPEDVEEVCKTFGGFILRR